MTQAVTHTDLEEVQIEEMRTILGFLADNIKNLTPLHFDNKKKKALRDLVSVWRWYISHGYFEEPNEHINEDKPPIGWLHNILMSYRSVSSLITLLAAPGIPGGSDVTNGAGVLMFKLGRILTYTTVPEIPKTFYLPPSDPKKTDQDGVPWKQSKTGAAKKWRYRLKKERSDRESLLPKPKPEMSEEERVRKTKEYLTKKDKRRAEVKKHRKEAEEDADRRYEIDKAAEMKRRKKRLGL